MQDQRSGTTHVFVHVTIGAVMKPKVEPEPWLRGTLTEVPAVIRAVLHAMELAREDVERWSEELTDSELNTRELGLPSVAQQALHIARSVDRLLTYAEGKQLSDAQLAALKSEGEVRSREQVFAEFRSTIDEAMRRVRAFESSQFEDRRAVGRKQLPTTVGGLLVHVADHTQRHVGQLITTVKVVVAKRPLT
jgi:uncharacterized damage-inducible protein DinB